MSKEAGKLEQNDSKITLHFQLKQADTKTLSLRVWGTFLRRISVYFN